jgi:transcriptional regulator with XRE-family HTH domain
MRTLREVRQARGWSVRETAAVIGVSFGDLAKVERGERPLSGENRVRLIRAFDLDAVQVREIAEFRLDEVLA